ncbi:hypothetical protein MTO96_044640 [Rhipicephalus appendiculatus]
MFVRFLRSRKGSGTEEQYGEREQLLQDISDLMRGGRLCAENRSADGKRHGATEKEGRGPTVDCWIVGIDQGAKRQGYAD